MKLILILTIALVLSISAIAMQPKLIEGKQCSNIRINVIANGTTQNKILFGMIALNGETLSDQIKTGTGDTKGLFNFVFNKITCPEVGDKYEGFVNGTHYSDTLDSLTKRNKAAQFNLP